MPDFFDPFIAEQQHVAKGLTVGDIYWRSRTKTAENKHRIATTYACPQTGDLHGRVLATNKTLRPTLDDCGNCLLLEPPAFVECLTIYIPEYLQFDIDTIITNTVTGIKYTPKFMPQRFTLYRFRCITSLGLIRADYSAIKASVGADAIVFSMFFNNTARTVRMLSFVGGGTESIVIDKTFLTRDVIAGDTLIIPLVGNKWVTATINPQPCDGAWSLSAGFAPQLTLVNPVTFWEWKPYVPPPP
jgi:hypothetical protein